MDTIDEKQILKKITHSIGNVFILAKNKKLYKSTGKSIYFTGYDNIKDIEKNGIGINFVDLNDRLGAVSASYDGKPLGLSGYTGYKKINGTFVSEQKRCAIC
jgi:hypothetical protein